MGDPDTLDPMGKKGRKPLKADELRSAKVTIRVRQDQRDLYEDAAEARGLTLSQWVAEVLDRAAKRATRSGPKS